jgi:small subunit ribosomal protein S16
MIKKHLLEGVKKGAFDEAEALKRFETWMTQNEAKIEAKKSGLEKNQDDQTSERLAAEKKVNEARAARLEKKQAELAAKAEAESKPVPVAEEEAPVAEEQAPAEDVQEAPPADATPVSGEAAVEPVAE